MSNIPEVQSIDEQIAALQAKKRELLDAKRKEALEQAKALVHAFNLTAQELALTNAIKASKNLSSSRKKNGKREPIYRNTNNPNETWAGGAKPKWVRAFEASGGDIETCRIKK